MFSVEPTKQHWTGVKCILKYLKGTADYGLAFTTNASGVYVEYADADWGGDAWC